MSNERRPSFSGMAPRPKSRGWRPLSRSMVRAASPTLKSGDEAALAALRSPPAQRTVEEQAAVRRWSERSVRLPGGTTHEELCTVMTLEEHPPHSLLFRQGTPGEAPRAKSRHRPLQGHARPSTATRARACRPLEAATCRQHRRAALLGCRRLPAPRASRAWRLSDSCSASYTHAYTHICASAGETFYVVFSGEVGLYFEPGAPEDAVRVASTSVE